MSAIIQVTGVCKWYAPQLTGFQGFLRAVRHGGMLPSDSSGAPSDAHVALHPLSFELERGQVLGIVGRNGAGKSTLLQLLSGTLFPSSGHITINGRIAALLELGAGFNPEFTGLENVYLNGSILGLSKREISNRLDTILGFADIGRFINLPVKTYSSGMFVRLAFSVAVCVDPDVLIIDEALAVGDGPFARKSFQKIMDFRDNGKTILFCSHSLYQIESLCSHVMWLDHGRLMRYGECADILAAYSQFIDRASSSSNIHSLVAGFDADQPSVSDSTSNQSVDKAKSDVCSHEHNKEIFSDKALPENPRLIKILVWLNGNLLELSDDASRRLVLNYGISSKLELEIFWQMSPLEGDSVENGSAKFERPTVALSLMTSTGQCLAAVSTLNQSKVIRQDSFGRGHVAINIPDLPLCKGQFRLDVLLGCSRGLQLYDQAVGVVHLDVRSQAHEQGMISIRHSWRSMETTQLETVERFYDMFRDYWQHLSAHNASDPTDILNFGYWPDGVANLQQAQHALLDLLIELLLEYSPFSLDWTRRSGLEFGCGIGGVGLGVLRRLDNVKLTGLDLSLVQLEIASENAQRLGLSDRYDIRQGDAMALEFPDCSEDFSLCIESSFHYPDKEAFIRENYRVLKPGGISIIADITCIDPEMVRFRKGNYFWSAEAYITRSRDVGFELLKHLDIGKSVFNPLLAHVIAFNGSKSDQDRRGRYWEMVLSNYVRILSEGKMGYELFVLRKPEVATGA